jgi:hypothetical protein
LDQLDQKDLDEAGRRLCGGAPFARKSFESQVAGAAEAASDYAICPAELALTATTENFLPKEK